MSKAFDTGSRVRLALHCPIESEGVAPRPGDEGELVAPPRSDDSSRRWLVRFDGHTLPWSLPERFLSPLRRMH